jgi:hypothetical protein
MSARRGRMGWKPTFLQLETRDVPTVISPLAFGGAGLKAQQANAVADEKASGLATQAASPVGTTTPNLPLGLNFNPNPQINPATLTPLGKKAANFSGSVSGPIAISHSYFTDTARQVVYIGNYRGSPSQVLHGTLLMRVLIPTNPDDQIFGVAIIRDLNNATTGNNLVLDLTATATDSQGRPTQFTWLVDSSSSGGYTGAPGQGTLTITYLPGHSKSSAGNAISVFKGLVLTDATNVDTNFDVPHFA